MSNTRVNPIRCACRLAASLDFAGTTRERYINALKTWRQLWPEWGLGNSLSESSAGSGQALVASVSLRNLP